MENTPDSTNPSEIPQSFGVNRWQKKKNRYELEEFIVSPPSHDEGAFFQLRYGKNSSAKTSTYNKIAKELSQETFAASAMSYLGIGDQRQSIDKVGGSISMDAAGGLTFDDFSQRPDQELTMPDLTLETQLFPEADPLITLQWGKHSLSRDIKSTSKNPTESFSPNFDTEEWKIVQSIKNLNITGKEVTCADMTTQGSKNITMNILHDNHHQVKEKSPVRERKRSGLQDYISSISKQTNKPHHVEEDEEEEHDEEDKKEQKRRMSKEYERNSEMLGQNMEQNDKTSLNNQYSHPNNFNERIKEDQNNDMLYEPYVPLAPLEPVVIKDEQNKSKNEKRAESPEVKYDLKAQETVKLTKEDTRERKKSLLELASPFMPFRQSSTETENLPTPKVSREEVNEQKDKTKAVNNFFFTEGYETQRKSIGSEPNNLSLNCEQLKREESIISNDLASSTKPKVKTRRPKPSALREMNVWGPSSM